MNGFEAALLELVAKVYEGMGWPGVILLMAVENTGFPIPSEPIMMFAGWLLVQSRGDPAWFVLLAGFYGSIGSLIGAWIVYFISLKAGRPLLQRYGKYVLISEEDITRSEIWFAKYGNWAVFFCRLVPLVRTIISVPAGIAGMKFWKFSLYTLLGAFLWNTGLAYAGFLLGENWEQFRRLTQPFDVPILAALGAVTGWFLFRRLRTIRARSRNNLVSQSDPSGEGDG